MNPPPTPEAPKGAEAPKEAPPTLPPVLDSFVRKVVLLDENSETARTAITKYITKDSPDFLSQEEKALLGYSFGDLDQTYNNVIAGIDTTKLIDLEWDDATDIADNMGVFRINCLDPLIAELKNLKKQAEEKTAAEAKNKGAAEKLEKFTTSHVAKLKGRKDLPADVTTSLTALEGKITAYKATEDAKADGKYADMDTQITAFEAEFKPIFEAYKKAKVDAYKAANETETDAAKKVDITKLESAADFEAFITELDLLEATSKTPAPTQTPEEAAAEDADLVTDLLTSFGIPKKTVQEYLEKSPFVAMLIGILKIFMPSLFDGAIKTMPESATREVYCNLKSKDFNWVYKNHKDKDVAWETHKTNKEKATTWISTKFQSNYSSGRDAGILRSLLNSDYTIGDFKALSKHNDDSDLDAPETENDNSPTPTPVLEEADLPKDYVTSFPLVNDIFTEVMRLEGNKTDKDATNLSAYLAGLPLTTQTEGADANTPANE